MPKLLEKAYKLPLIKTYLKEFVYGGSDGIVTTFAVVAGFNGANLGSSLPSYSFFTVLLFGLANLFADGVSMGLGNFLSVRAEKDVYKSEEAKERKRVQINPPLEIEKTKRILAEKGFSEIQAEELVHVYKTNEKYWVQFMMDHKLRIPNPTFENPYLTGIATISAFMLFGIIPLIPYLISKNPNGAFTNSILATGFALILVGLLRWKVTGEGLLRSVSEVLLLGGAAAVIAYFVGTFFKL